MVTLHTSKRCFYKDNVIDWTGDIPGPIFKNKKRMGAEAPG